MVMVLQRLEGCSDGPMSLLWLRGNDGSYSQYRTSIAYLR